jgi:peptide/nickel transport system substrate-binding protein
MPVSEKSTLKIGIHTFPSSLNPLYVTDETSQAVVNKIFQSLFQFDSRGRMKKGLVQKYVFKKESNQIILTLKRGIFFSNGAQFRAADVKATIDKIRNKRFKSPYISALKFINKVKILNDQTVRIDLLTPLANWKSRLTFKILNSAQLKETNPDTFRNQILAGTGSYMIERIEEPSKILLKLIRSNRNKTMYNYIEYIVVSYSHLTPLKLLNKEIDICELHPGSNDAFLSNKKWQKKLSIVKYKKFGFTYLVFNLRNSLISANIRRIFYNTLICSDFIDKFLNQKGDRVNSPFLLLSDQVERKPFQPSPLKRRIKMKILTNSESKIRKEFILFLQKEVEKSNIYLEPIFLEYHSFLKKIKNSTYDIAVSGFLLDIDYDMKNIFNSHAYFNYANFKNKEMDCLLETGLIEMDTQRRKAIYLKAHNLWLQELPLIPLFNLYYYMGVSKKIKIPAETTTLMGSESDFLFNIEDWRVN